MQFHDRELNRWLLPREDQRHSCRSAATGEANDLLGEEHGAAGVGLLADDDELLAAEAGDGVGVALGAAEDLAEALDDDIADVVAVGVVDPLEVVDVDDQHAEVAVEALGWRLMTP